MNKKEFKSLCDVHNYGRGKGKKIAIFFDWKQGTIENKLYCGYKYLIYSTHYTQKDLINIMYDWITEKIQQVPYDVMYRYANEPMDRFKVPVCM